jgi:hypothetical protein
MLLDVERKKSFEPQSAKQFSTVDFYSDKSIYENVLARILWWARPHTGTGLKPPSSVDTHDSHSLRRVSSQSSMCVSQD